MRTLTALLCMCFFSFAFTQPTELRRTYLLPELRAQDEGITRPASRVSVEQSRAARDSGQITPQRRLISERLYDRHGLLQVSKSEYRGGTWKMQTRYRYDEKGRIIGFTGAHPQVGSIVKVERDYDDQGVTTERSYDRNGKLIALYERTEDLEHIYRRSVDVFMLFTLNQQGNVDKQIWFKEGQSWRNELTYNGRGQVEVLQGFDHAADAQPILTHTYTYDQYGNILTETRAKSGYEFRYKYEYDAFGSWIVKRTSVVIYEGLTVEDYLPTVYRTIDYY